MKVRLVCYEDVHHWILGKFALRMQDNLLNMKIDVDIDKVPDPNADINHHIIYVDFQPQKKCQGIDTLMITHIDNISKLQEIKNKLQSAEMGICMSKETMINLANLGISRSRLSFVNPAHDGIIKPRKLIVGITCRVQKDGRKREYLIDELADFLNPDDFEFIIMGEFWDQQVDNLISKGFSVKYIKHFDYGEYIKLIPSLDYYLYTGMDEGQMGFVDALSAGVKTIVTPQGYHLDAKNGITHAFTSSKELLQCFSAIINQRKKIVNSVEGWTWENYTKKHVEIWEYLLSGRIAESYNRKSNIISDDGLNSVEGFSSKYEKVAMHKRFIKLQKLFVERFRQYYYIKVNKNRKD